jgi:pimeloyl-ACP methyl ester carboxylesterase
MTRLLVFVCFAVCLIGQEIPAPPGKLVDLGGHRLHVNCSGNGGPAVLVELGLGDFSFEWILVQNEVARFTRICTYDRAGHAWSDPGPQPRTYAQINLELRDALRKLGVRGPYVLVGHSFGGPVVRQFAADYPKDVAGMVFVDTVHQDQRVVIQGKAVQLRATADGRPIPPAREKLTDAERTTRKPLVPSPGGTVSAPLDRLPAAEQKLSLWAAAQAGVQEAENSERTWSPEYLKRMHDTPQKGILGAIPLVVLTRAEGGYSNKLDLPAEQLEADRLRQQKELAELSTNGTQKVLKCGHNMHLECPGDVVAAIREVVERVRKP